MIIKKLVYTLLSLSLLVPQLTTQRQPRQRTERFSSRKRINPTLDCHTKKMTPSSAAQTIGLNFTAATLGNAHDVFVTPPNLSGYLGPQQYILMSYNAIRSFNSSTGQPDGMLDIDSDSFFGGPTNDVRITYDRFAQRWLMSCEGAANSSTLVLVMSSSSVINSSTTWSYHSFTNAEIMPNTKPSGQGTLDYQQLAVDKNAVYITIDAFEKSGNFHGTSLVVIQKSSLVSGGPLKYTVFPGILPGPQQSGFTPPADNFDPKPTFGYIVNAANNQYPSGDTYTHLYMYRISDAGSTKPTLSSAIAIPVPTYTDPANAPYQGNLFGSQAFIQTTFSRLSALHVRNKQLYACHNIQVDFTGKANPNGNRVGVRWYQFDLTGDATGHARNTEKVTTVPALVQSGTIYDSSSSSSPLFYFNPSIMSNKNGSIALSFSVSSATSYPNAAYAGRLATDALGTLRAPVLITTSSNSFNFGPFVNPSDGNIGQRWGDLSSVCSDPVNDLNMWATQEFSAVPNGWGIQVTQLIPAS